MALTAELADGRRLEFPDGTDPTVVQATVKRMISSAPAVPPAPTSTEKESSLLGNIASGAGNLGAGAFRGFGSIGATLLAPYDMAKDAIAGKGLSLESNRERRKGIDEGLQAMGADPESAMYGIGKFGGEMAGTLGTGGVLAKGAQALGATPKVIQALQTWGMNTGASPVGIAQRVADVGLRAGAGGLVGGAAGTAINPEHAGMSAGIGAGAAAVLPPVLSGTSKVIGKVYDAITGRWGAVKAGDILQQSAGKDLDAIKAAMATADPSLTAVQATGGIRKDVFDSLGDLATKNDKTNYFTDIASRQKEDLIDAISKIAGGRNQTDALTAGKEGRKALSAQVAPKMQIELDAANMGGTIGRRLQSEQEMLADAVTNKVEDVRRLSKAGQIAEDLGNSGRMRLDGGAPPVPGLPRISGRYSYGQELSNLAERITSGAADDSLIIGQAARFKQMQIDSLAAHGLQPIDTNRIVSGIRSKLNDNSIAGNETAENVLLTVSNAIKTWTEKAGGVIDAEALHAIRKNSVNSALEKLGVLDPKQKQEMSSKVLLQVKPLIDEAIEAAGGKGWRAALKEYENGARLLDQQKMGAKALEMLEKSPRKFTELVDGNNPKQVQKIFQTEHDISKAMGPQFESMKRVSDAVMRDRQIKEGATRGQTGMKNIIDENTLSFILPNWINASIAVMNRGLKMTESGLNESTLRALEAGMKTGKSANELLNTLPTAQRVRVVEALLPYASASSITKSQQGE